MSDTEAAPTTETEAALGVAERDPLGNFLGIVGSDCGEHRTVGTYRAWCHADSMWCYPGDPCYGCAAPITSARIQSLVAELESCRSDLVGLRAKIEALADDMERRGGNLQLTPELKLVGNAYVGSGQRLRALMETP